MLNRSINMFYYVSNVFNIYRNYSALLSIMPERVFSSLQGMAYEYSKQDYFYSNLCSTWESRQLRHPRLLDLVLWCHIQPSIMIVLDFHQKTLPTDGYSPKDSVSQSVGRDAFLLAWTNLSFRYCLWRIRGTLTMGSSIWSALLKSQVGVP